MATEKNIKSRIINKHDIEANWNKAVGFIPQQGELIVYDIELDGEGNALALPEGRTTPYTYERFKIGDGKTTAINLPFYLENELNDILDKMDYLANNMLDATCENGILLLNKGIIFPNL